MRKLPFDLIDRYSDWRHSVIRSSYVFERGGERRFVKLRPTGMELPDEAQRLRWAAEWVNVPRVIEYGTDGDTDWLMTASLDGVDATRHRWLTEDPRRLVIEFGEALRRFHEAIPVSECPFVLSDPPAVVCHGDYRFTNALIVDDKITGYVDLGRLGAGSAQWDLEAGIKSCEYNLGPGYERLFLEAYGVTT